MRNKELFKKAIIITALSLSVSMIAGGCGKQEEEVISESVEEVTPAEEESKPDLGYTVIPVEDTQMFATSAANIEKDPLQNMIRLEVYHMLRRLQSMVK